MSRPAAIPTWATDDTYTNGPTIGQPTKVAPPSAAAAEGWRPSQKPPAQYQNWFQNLAGEWFTHLASMLLARADVWHTETGFVPEETVNGTRCIACLDSLSPVDGDPWVMVDGDTFMTSKYGNAWTSRAHTALTGVNRGVFAINPSGVLLVVDDDGEIRRSTDGLTWTDPTNPVSAGIFDVAANEDGSLIVAACGDSSGGAADGFILSDDNGATWTSVDSEQDAPVQKLVWTGVYWIALGASFCIRSGSDALLWTVRTSPVSGTKLGLAANVRTGVALAISTTDDSIFRTTNGTTWETLSAPGPSGQNHRALVCVNGVFVLLRSATHPVWYSVDDGDTWHQVFGPLLESSGVAFGQGGFLIAAVDGSDTELRTTPKAPW